MKVVVIGATGLLGNALADELKRKNVNYLALTHNGFDITDVKSYEKIKDFNPDIVINTAAFLGVEPCEKNPMEAFNINVVAVENLAKFCDKNGYCLSYISTDGVFDGIKGDYDEDSIPNPLNMYGLTKYNGELMTKNLCRKYYIFRIPILFGNRKNKGNIFIEKMFNLYKSGQKKLKIADDIISKPSYNKDVAKGILDIILDRYDFGIYHIFNSGNGISLYDFANEFFTQMGARDITIERAKAKDFVKNEKGKKPLDTRLTSIKIEPLRDWKVAMKEYVENLNLLYKEK